MNWTNRFRILMACLMALPSVLMAAQQLTWTDILRGDKIPRALEAKDLPATAYAVRIQQGSDANNGMPTWMSLMMMSPSGGRDGLIGAAMSLEQVSWTDGSSVQIGGQDYLVTYRMRITDELLRLQMALPPGSHVESPQGFAPKLQLELVKTTAITNFSPIENMTVATLVDTLNKINGGMSPQPVPVDEGAVPIAIVPTEQSMASKKSASLSNAKQIALGVMMYSSDYDDAMPYVQSTRSLFGVIQPYVKNNNIYRTLNPSGGSFLFNMDVSGILTTQVKNPATTVLCYDSREWPDGSRIVAFMDGSAKTVSRETWKTLYGPGKLKLKKVGRPLPLNYMTQGIPIELGTP